MLKRKYTAMAFALLGLCGYPPASAQAGEVGTPEDVVDAMTELYGSHKTFRTVHAKGFCGVGTFEPTPEAKDISKVAIFDGRTVPVMFRFSLGSGLPDASDKQPAARSLVMRFQPEAGSTMDLLTINLPIVFANNAKDFAAFFRVLKPDPATGKLDEAKFKAYVASHPDTQRFMEVAGKIPTPLSYATARYFAVHTFHFTNAKGERRAARWRAEPAAGEVGITDDQGTTLKDDFYAAEMRERVAKEPVAWDLYLQLAEPGDALDDPTVLWPESRKSVMVGRLKLAALEPTNSRGPCDVEMFDPNSLLDGVEASNDPILKIRTEGYAISFSRRMNQ